MAFQRRVSGVLIFRKEAFEMGSIYKRGETYWIKYYRQGKPYYESTKSGKENDAKRLLRKREGEISEGKPPGIYFDKVLFDELAADLVPITRSTG
jgi:hypothetical protein